MEEEREEMERIELDIPKDIYEFCLERAKEQGVPVEEYIKKIFSIQLAKGLSDIWMEKDDKVM